jgi:hypothetical protein
MESLRHRSAALITAAALALFLAATPAGADRRDVDAETDGNGIDVLFTRQEDGSATGQPRSGSSDCTWKALPVDPLSFAEVGMEVPDQRDPDDRLYALYCDAEYRGLAWLGARDFVASPSDPVLEQLVRRIELLPAQVHVRPDTRGVTGIPSLFWVDGYDGAPIRETLTAFGVTVTVEATLRDAVWDFGDGTPRVHTGLGEAWPRRSSVRHNYADPSPAGGYPVTVQVTLEPTYSVDGGAPASLPPIVLTFTRSYEVREVQAVRNS